MEWLKPIIERLSVNSLIAAIGITSLGCWFFYKTPLLIAIFFCCALYLFFYFIAFCYDTYKRNTARDRAEKERLERILDEDSAIRKRIDIWFASISVDHKEKLLQLLKWESSPTAVNIKICPSIDKYIHLIPQNYTIDMGLHRDPIRLIYPIENKTPGSNTTYFIHPHLIRLLMDSTTTNNR